MSAATVRSFEIVNTSASMSLIIRQQVSPPVKVRIVRPASFMLISSKKTNSSGYAGERSYQIFDAVEKSDNTADGENQYQPNRKGYQNNDKSKQALKNDGVHAEFQN